MMVPCDVGEGHMRARAHTQTHTQSEMWSVNLNLSKSVNSTEFTYFGIKINAITSIILNARNV